MSAKFFLDTTNSKYVFEAPDFRLQVAISHLIVKIVKVVNINGSIIEFICNDDYEEYFDLNYFSGILGITWDFSKYNIEVIL